MLKLTRREISCLPLMALAVPAIGAVSPAITRMPRRAPKMFGLVYTKESHEVRRLIDTSDDLDDRHLIYARAALAPDEILEIFPVNDFPVKRPRLVARHIGQGIVL